LGRVGLGVRLRAQHQARPRDAAERQARAHVSEAAENDIEEPGYGVAFTVKVNLPVTTWPSVDSTCHSTR
jgi:hypothetical protein